MGTNSSACLAYGYDLGGAEHVWKFTIKGIPYEELYPQDYLFWFNIKEDDDVNFAESLMAKLLHNAGWKATDWRTDPTYFKRKNALEKSLGIEVQRYGSYDYASYILCTKRFRVGWDAIPVLPYIDPTWNTILNSAITALGIKPTQSEPKWILSSFYG